MLRAALVALITFAAAIPVAAQSAQATNNILFRTLMVRTSTDQGTMFSIDVDGREYWLTAKHLLTGAKHPPYGSITAKEVSLFVLDPNTVEAKWVPYKFSVLDPGKDIDIAILAPGRSIQRFSIPSLSVSSDKAPVGGECEFLGFPFASTWMANLDNGESYRMPYVKHCYVSGQIKAPSTVWVLDGINNEGFSGGPVVIYTGSQQTILGVVSGYQAELSDVLSVPAEQQPAPGRPSGSQSKDSSSPAKHRNVVSLNTGLIFAFDAACAIDAIKKNPIGPVVETK